MCDLICCALGNVLFVFKQYNTLLKKIVFYLSYIIKNFPTASALKAVMLLPLSTGTPTTWVRKPTMCSHGGKTTRWTST